MLRILLSIVSRRGDLLESGTSAATMIIWSRRVLNHSFILKVVLDLHCKGVFMSLCTYLFDRIALLSLCSKVSG
jgi:hypothetical protein